MIDEQITLATVTQILSKQLKKTVLSADYRTTQLHGGTLGDVKLVAGSAKTSDGAVEPFKLVCKMQKKWERPGDPQSWRREYDLYGSDFDSVFFDTLRWPACYRAENNREGSVLWMEYIDGVSGGDLTVEMLEKAALELGRFQGRLSGRHDDFRRISCLGDEGFLEREYTQWHTQSFTYDFLISEPCRIPGFLKQMLRDGGIVLTQGKSFEYGCLRSRGCVIPSHLKQMLIDIDDNRDKLFYKLKTLPVVLCHRDFWTENIFYAGGKIILIDWDCAGFGYMGEDIASLIVDDTETENLHEYFCRLIPAYMKGISQFVDTPPLENHVIWEMMLLKFGYRIMQTYMFTTSDDVKEESVNRLQKIYEMRDM